MQVEKCENVVYYSYFTIGPKVKAVQNWHNSYIQTQSREKQREAKLYKSTR